MMYWDGHGGGWAFAMAFGMVVFWGGALTLLWSALRALAPRDRDSGDDARAILDLRLARGEIDVDEYRERRELVSTRR